MAVQQATRTPLQQQSQEKRRAQERNRALQISRREKREMIRSMSGWKERFSLDFLNSLFIPPIGREESLHDLVSRIPLHLSFSPSLPEKGYFPCVFFDGHYAWIFQDEADHYRYYTRPKGCRSMKGTLSLDFADMVELALNLTPAEAVRRIIDRLPDRIIGREWCGSLAHYQKVRDEWLSSSLPNLKLIRPLMPVFFDLLMEGERQASAAHWRSGGAPVFFCSHRHLARRSGDRSRSSVTRALNGLAALGMIRKVPMDEVPASLMERAKLWTEKMDYTFHLSFFAIPGFQEAEPKVRRAYGEWRRSGLSSGRVSKDLVREASGEDQASAVYPQVDIGKDLCVLEAVLADTFSRSVRKGFVSKSMLTSQPVLGFSKAEVKRCVEQCWNGWLSENGCRYGRPSKQMRDAFGLGNGHVAWLSETE